MTTKPIKLYGHTLGPNPWKVALILEELNVPYETEYKEFSDIKTPEFLALSPNGRVPVIQDPNSGITLWESGAIIDYLLDTYDKQNNLRFPGTPEKYYQLQWRDFQMSGQGPYFGQKAWFTLFHEEKNITSAINRYGNEIRRVLGVIDLHLKSTGQQYLVGSKATYVDLMFVPWNTMLGFIDGENFEAEWKEKYPTCYEWHQRIISRPAVKKVLDAKAKKVAESQG